MATFSYDPEFGAQVAHKPNVRVAKYGDGYEQRLAYGINTSPQNWSLQFNSRSNAEADAIEAFLQARGGAENFDWTPPNGSTSMKFVCREWTRSMDKYNLNSISATFEQVFEP